MDKKNNQKKEKKNAFRIERASDECCICGSLMIKIRSPLFIGFRFGF